jgi:hypothetical protein
MRGARWLRSLRGPEQWYQLLDRVEQERQHRVLTGEFAAVTPFEVMPVDSQTVPFIRQHWAKIPNLPRSMTFDTVEAVLEYDPQGVIQHIAPRPLLMMAVERDQIVPNEETLEAFAEAREPKKLVWLPRHLGHWGAYVGEGFECELHDRVSLLFRETRERTNRKNYRPFPPLLSRRARRWRLPRHAAAASC